MTDDQPQSDEPTGNSDDELEPMKFEVLIDGTMEQVWDELTKTDEVQKAMFNSRMDTTGLAPGAPIRMRSPNGRYTAVVGEVLQVEQPVRFSHTFRFTQYDDPECEVIYDLEQTGEGVRFRLTVARAPAGTRTAKQMKQGGPMICNTLKALIETGKPPLGIRALYLLFGLLAPLTPKRCRSENWPLDRVA